ncbi:MAG: hydrogenase nickel incorporation protein HypB [Caldisericales bacterium]|nr:hydrogenase nickel incorporation protein HypB [Caldisericales bacterium]
MDLELSRKVDFRHEEIASRIKEKLYKRGTLCLNFISSPGSGKTSLLERTLDALKETYNLAVIEGDPETDRDARRLEKLHVPVILINTSGTGASCHLSPAEVEQAIDDLLLETPPPDIIFIENVGNLVCPAAYDLGEHNKVLLFSVPEGCDKPAKYPVAFRESDLVLINKMDLAPYCDFDLESLKKDALSVNPSLEFITMSIKKGDGLLEWFSWIEKKLVEVRKHTNSK